MRERARVVTGSRPGSGRQSRPSVKFVAASTPAPAVNLWQLARLVVVAGPQTDEVDCAGRCTLSKCKLVRRAAIHTLLRTTSSRSCLKRCCRISCNKVLREVLKIPNLDCYLVVLILNSTNHQELDRLRSHKA